MPPPARKPSVRTPQRAEPRRVAGREPGRASAGRARARPRSGSSSPAPALGQPRGALPDRRRGRRARHVGPGHRVGPARLGRDARRRRRVVVVGPDAPALLPRPGGVGSRVDARGRARRPRPATGAGSTRRCRKADEALEALGVSAAATVSVPTSASVRRPRSIPRVAVPPSVQIERARELDIRSPT